MWMAKKYIQINIYEPTYLTSSRVKKRSQILPIDKCFDDVDFTFRLIHSTIKCYISHSAPCQYSYTSFYIHHLERIYFH